MQDKHNTQAPSGLQAAIIRPTDFEGQQTAVDARTLHAFLENGDGFHDWFKDRVQQYGFVEGIDYAPIKTENSVKIGRGRPAKDYALTIDMAKELAMVERNAKGKEARLYFIEMERQAKNLAIQVPQSLPEALRLAAELAERAEKQEAAIKALEPKAAFHDTVADAVDCHTVQEVAKMLNIGPNKFFDWLRANQILMTIGERRNIPYQEFIDRGYFRLIEKPWKDVHGECHTHQRTYVTGKGFIWLEKKFRESQAA